jgi:hypothetical protein
MSRLVLVLWAGGWVVAVVSLQALAPLARALGLEPRRRRQLRRRPLVATPPELVALERIVRDALAGDPQARRRLGERLDVEVRDRRDLMAVLGRLPRVEGSEGDEATPARR